ncbi:contact-dependent growth inhibition system immunity protein [Elizabethkingia anophelis]|uniref:contact-dependent growth inhibition system immunity protein n=2 Tax=Elizabethkingia TaxID=308865 RepID=UPI000D8B80EC|nr:contact-dependent growth inhibition system immunity protein [Elizabethkingia anophelis]MCL1643566.1 contact-dependent growth inhibition system immunity protein [Elizabethkingia anophelis]MCL1646964.1 contact-dependent growth inhibition system immunity protein [Elizabethkingia anophelis]MCL1649351.1 contact-dependent growth inhibition system immunity protein [Elizabethkingia anophelis]MCL1684505.1 contact-dependent growth inhibition system immunity protein [Elizabethkingia anophelis]MCT39287
MMDSFQVNFPLTYQLLGAWFSDIDYEDITYEEVIENYKKVTKKQDLDLLKLELPELKRELNKNTIDYKYISRLSNIYFENNDNVLKWLNEIFTYLEEYKT